MLGLSRYLIRQCARPWQQRANFNQVKGVTLHTFQILLCGVLIIAAIVLVLCHINDENMTPVGKTFGSVFTALVALILTINTVMDHPQVSGYARVAQVLEAAPVGQGGRVLEAEPRQSTPALSSDVPVEQVRQAPVQVMTSAPAVAPVAAPAADSSFKDMALGGALGYLAGSAGRNSGSTHTVTHVVHEASPTPPPAPSRSSWSPSPSPRAAAPAAAKVAPPRSPFRSAFSMTRSRR